MRNRASPLIILSKAACASDSGIVSIIGPTPVIADKRSVSSESYEVPDAWPWTAEDLKMIEAPGT